MDYREAIEWLDSTQRFGSRLGLERIRRLLDILGRPQDSVRFVHIAGTNGKGSVTAMIASVLERAGFRTGLYTSPHLEDFRERIRVDGKKIREEEVAELAARVREKITEMVAAGEDHPTEFEIITAMALVYFKERLCDWVSLEVGLGGRLDATNVVIPAVSVITPISFDHTDRLGNTLAQIAAEKAGIIKPGVPVVTGPQEGEALEVILKTAQDLRCPVVVVGRDVSWRIVTQSLEGQWVEVFWEGKFCGELFVPLAGTHQAQNAATAVAVLRVLNRSGVEIDWDAVRSGIAATKWPGRLEVVSKEPLVILDGAHNPGGAAALAGSLPLIPRKQLICVVGMLGDKDYRTVLPLVLPACSMVIATTPASERALEAEKLAEEARKYCSSVLVEPDVERALRAGLDRASRDDAVLVWGSLYLVGPARALLRDKLGILREERE